MKKPPMVGSVNRSSIDEWIRLQQPAARGSSGRSEWPLVELISELSASDDPRDHKLVAEFLKETAMEANAIHYERGLDQIATQLPPGALDEFRDD